MEKLKEHSRELAKLWSAVLADIKSADGPPAELSAYSTDQLDEALKTTTSWMGAINAPRGFAPNFQLAKAAAANALTATISSLRPFEQHDYSRADTFVASLAQLVGALHTMAAFSPDSREAIAHLGGQLSESLALVDTAQRELADKVRDLNAATDAANTLKGATEAAAATAQSAETHAREAAAAAEAQSARASDLATSIQERAAKASALESDLVEMRSALSENLQSLSKAREEADDKAHDYWRRLEHLEDRATQQANLIDELLPKGASAGLAAAFALRVRQVERTKWIWLAVFAVSIGVLAATAFGLVQQPEPQGTEIWRDLLHRLPLAAPLVWLGWFSAIQYGNVVRLQEDYAFKEATSKAFAGYRDHMQHMATVGAKDAANAMALLSERTIEILAREPLRIYGKTERDAAPTHSLLESIAGLTRKESGAPKPPNPAVE